jgi:hypothetical protein
VWWYFTVRMKTRDVVVVFLVLVIVVAGILMVNKIKLPKKVAMPSPTPSIQEKVESRFVGLVIPWDVEKVELKDVSGGEAVGIATRTEILAALAGGEVYRGWLENEEEKMVLLGSFRVAKGGYILEYNSAKAPGYNKVVVTLGDKHILEGSF